MSPFVLSLPTDDPALRDEIVQRLEPFAEVHEPPATFDMEAVKLLVEIAVGASTVLANSAAIATFLMMLKKERREQAEKIKIARLGERERSLVELDKAELRRLLEGRSGKDEG